MKENVLSRDVSAFMDGYLHGLFVALSKVTSHLQNMEKNSSLSKFIVQFWPTLKRYLWQSYKGMLDMRFLLD